MIINVNKTSITVTPYKRGDCEKLEKILSVFDKATFSYSWENFHIEDDTLYLPRGFDLNYINYLFPEHEVKINNKVSKYKTAIYKCNVEPRDEKQEEAIDFLLSKGNFINLRNNSQRMLNLATGTGKAQPVNTVIPTPSGFKQLGDLKIGDYVFDRYGQPTKVIGIFPQGKMDNYEVTLGDTNEETNYETFLVAIPVKPYTTYTIGSINQNGIFVGTITAMTRYGGRSGDLAKTTNGSAYSIDRRKHEN